MRRHTTFGFAAIAALISLFSLLAIAQQHGGGRARAHKNVQLGPRPFFLVNDMTDSPLNKQLQSCADGPFAKSDFSIGHRGACLQFPEHTRESYEAAARMGARHSQNDLHTTTNILATDLARTCIVPFTPAVLGPNGEEITPATAECRTSELTLAEFKSLRGKMDGFNPRAQTPQQYLAGTPPFRTDLYSGPTSGHLMSHKESIQLFKELGVKMTPELKGPAVPMPFNGFTQEAYAQKMIDEYKAAGVNPSRVFPQSFNQADVLYWINQETAYGKRAVYLDDAESVDDLPGPGELATYKQMGINIVGPPLFALLDVLGGQIVPSQYAMNSKAAGLDIIGWTLERSGILADGNNEFYFQTFDSAISREGDVMMVLDVLAKEVGVLGIFSDWAATTTDYANCMESK
jgi:glycerophosphoryl diester phosphodiesterase